MSEEPDFKCPFCQSENLVAYEQKFWKPCFMDKADITLTTEVVGKCEDCGAMGINSGGPTSFIKIYGDK